VSAVLVVLALLTALALGGALLAGIVVAGMRRGDPRIRRAVRRFNRDVVNPRALRSAGRRGAAFAVLRHRGRRTGRSYATPIGASTAEGGFIVALPYGADVHWLRNVQAAGSALLEVDGVEYRVDGPRVVPTAATRLAGDAAIRAFGVRSAVLLRAEPIAP